MGYSPSQTSAFPDVNLGISSSASHNPAVRFDQAEGMEPPYEYVNTKRHTLTYLGAAASIFMLGVASVGGGAPIIWWVAWGAYSVLIVYSLIIRSSYRLEINSMTVSVTYGRKTDSFPVSQIKHFAYRDRDQVSDGVFYFLDGSSYRVSAQALPPRDDFKKQLARFNIASL